MPVPLSRIRPTACQRLNNRLPSLSTEDTVLVVNDFRGDLSASRIIVPFTFKGLNVSLHRGKSSLLANIRLQIMHDDEPAVGLWRGGIDDGRMSHA
jgi:hypothetical protein